MDRTNRRIRKISSLPLVARTPPPIVSSIINPLERSVCRCCDNGVTCQFALLLFVEE